MGKRTYRMNSRATRRIFRNPHGFSAGSFKKGITEKSMTLSPEGEIKFRDELNKMRHPVRSYGECNRCGELGDFSPESYKEYGENLCFSCAENCLQ